VDVVRDDAGSRPERSCEREVGVEREDARLSAPCAFSRSSDACVFSYSAACLGRKHDLRDCTEAKSGETSVDELVSITSRPRGTGARLRRRGSTVAVAHISRARDA